MRNKKLFIGLSIFAAVVLIVTMAFADSFTTAIVRNRLVNHGNTVIVPQTLASATTLTLPEYGTHFRLTGTAKCTRILPGSGTADGRLIYLWHTSTDTLIDGVNLLLAGNFNGTSDDFIVLAQRDTFFVEVSRSAN